MYFKDIVMTFTAFFGATLITLTVRPSHSVWLQAVHKFNVLLKCI